MDLNNPEHVAKELRRRGLAVWKSSDVLHNDEELREVFSSARLGGWISTEKIRASHINRGRLIRVLEDE